MKPEKPKPPRIREPVKLDFSLKGEAFRRQLRKNGPPFRAENIELWSREKESPNWFVKKPD